MNRRKFVTIGTTTLCAIPFVGFTAFNATKDGVPVAKPKWLIDLILYNDEDVKQIASYKVTDNSHKYYGGYYSDTAIPNPHTTCAFINRACGAISCPESVYYQSAALLKDIEEALNCLLKMQHEDGTIDLLDTNFHSTPDTGFMVKRLVQSYKLLKQSNTKGYQKALQRLEQFLKNAGEALITGGLHTPNHRWVVSAALTKMNELSPDPRYVNRANEWLGEHIDIDPDGQYTEKSTYGYSAIIDRVLITVAKGLNKPELYDAVRKNILMMRYYIHPNGEVVTEASNRQDKGQIGTMENYYYACRYMSLKDNDGEMASICRLIESTSFRKLVDVLNYFLEDPSLWKELPPDKALPVSYAISFPYSGLVRIRREIWDTTILSANPAWLTFHKGNAVLQGMRVAASFFGKGQFESDDIKRIGDTWVLSKKLEGVYYQPYPKDQISPDGDIAKMPRINRPKSNIQYLETKISIAEISNGISVDIEMNGTEGVPVTMELIFRKGGNFAGVQAHPTKADAYLFSEFAGSYTVGNNTIQFGPGKLEHKGIQLRGALPAMDAPTVYLTGFTPFKHSIHLT